MQIAKPQTISPNQPLEFEYQSPLKLAVGGIYETKEVERMQDQLMCPIERSAITNVIVRGMTGQQPDLQGLSLGNVIDDTLVEKIRNNIFSTLWGGFSVFGNVVSGLIGCLVVVKLVKWVIDIILQGKILYDLYGVSIVIIGAVWNSLTTYLVHRKQSMDNGRSRAGPTTVKVSPDTQTEDISKAPKGIARIYPPANPQGGSEVHATNPKPETYQQRDQTGMMISVLPPTWPSTNSRRQDNPSSDW